MGVCPSNNSWPVNERIESQHERIPWRWVVVLSLFDLIRVFGFLVSGSMTFTLRKFYDSPIAIQGIQNMDLLFNLLIAIPCLYFSDRIWTRFGRRLPFTIVSFFILIFAMIFIPLVDSKWTLTILIIVWYMFWDVGSCFETLIWEIIPPSQRARYGVIKTWFFNGGMMIGGLVISGRFDDLLNSESLRINGEQLIYWWGAGCLTFCTIFLLLFVREVKPDEPPPPPAGNPILAPIKALFAEKDLRPIYLLLISVQFMQIFGSPMEALLWTEQWGYSKQDMATNLFLAGLFYVAVLIPLIGIFTERVSRLKLFIIGAVGGLLADLAFYLFVMVVLPDHRPSLNQIYLFGIMQSGIGLLGGVAMWPLIYEFVPRKKMGIAQGGIKLIGSIFKMFLLSGVAVFVTVYSGIFMPEGEYDYFSMRLYNLLFHGLGLLLIARFVYLLKKGRISRLGVEQFHSVEEQSADSTQQSEVPS